MKQGSSLFVVGLLAGVVVSSAAFAWMARKSDGASDRSTRVLRLAHGLPPAHPVHQGMEFMARRAAELSGGRLQMEIFHSEQLGNETQCLEQVQAGTLAITKVSAGAIGNFVSVYKVFGLPYLFRDEDHCWKVLEGGIGTELLEKLEVADDGRPSGLRGLCFYDAGSRNFYGKEPIRTPEDLRGKKIRVMPDQVAMDIVRSLGGAPTPIPWGELYSALQQGVVDGAENNPPSLLTSRHYDHCKHFTLNHHTRLPDVLVVSATIWGRLSPEEQGWLQRAADESSEYQRRLWAEEGGKVLAELKAAGVQIYEVDTEPFRKATQPVRDKYGEGAIGEYVKRIEREL